MAASHPRVNETSTSDFHQTVLPRMATIDARNGPIAQISDRGTRALVVVKEGTNANTGRTKLEGMKIDNEFSDLKKGNNYPYFEKGNN